MEPKYENQAFYGPLPIKYILVKIADSISESERLINCLLWAECEKLNKVIHSCSRTSELIAVNDSVAEMVKQIAELEHALKEKLGEILPCLCDYERVECHQCHQYMPAEEMQGMSA